MQGDALWSQAMEEAATGVHVTRFHPNRSVFSVGMIDGSVQLMDWDTASSSAKVVWKQNDHQASCRAINMEVDELVTVSLDKSICRRSMESGVPITSVADAHETGINCLATYANRFRMTGDDDGKLKLWDFRLKKPEALHMNHGNEEYVSSIVAYSDKQTVLSTSGEQLAVWDLRGSSKLKIEALSDELEEEVLSCSVIKNGNKVVCGSEEGTLLIFSWGDFGDVSDRFPGHSDSIDDMLTYDEDTIVTACSDGLIRLVQIHENKLLGVLASHDDQPVTAMDISTDQRLLVSASLDNVVHVWNVAMEDDSSDESEHAGKKREAEETQRSSKKNKSQSARAFQRASHQDETFFDAL